MRKILLALLLLCLPAYAQQEDAGTSIVKATRSAASKNNIFTMDDFSGGLNSKRSPFNLPKNQSDIAENVRFDSQLTALTKRDKVLVYGTASATSPILGLHRFYLSDGSKVLLTNYGSTVAKGNDTTGAFTSILSVSQSDRKWQWLTWHNLAIGTDGYNQPVKYNGTSTSATYLGSLLATDAGSGTGTSGTYTYKVSCYTSSYNLNLGSASNTIVMTGNDISLSMIPICQDTYLGQTVIGRKVYRTGNGDSTYKLLSNGTITNNTATTLTDSDADGDRGNLLTSDVTTTSAPPKGRLSIIHFNRLWIANDPSHPSRIYYSEDSAHDIFLPDSYFDIRQNDGDEITMVAQVLGILTVGKTNSIQKIYTDQGDTGDPATDWNVSDPFTFVGCHAMYSAVNTTKGLFYLSNNGLYVFTGQNSTLVSDDITPEINDISPSNISNTWGAYYKNSYYLTYTSKKSGGSSNNRVIVFDTLSKGYSIDTLNINVFHVLKSGSDVEILYSGGSATGKIYAHSDSTKEIIHRRASDFTGTYTEMRNRSIDSEDPELELARTATIDALVGTIDSLTGTIDRSSTTGNYISQPLTVGASRYDKIYWNETLPTAGSNVTFAVRSAATVDSLGNGPFTSWSSEVSDPSGSDISANTANAVIEYRISMTTDDLAYTPTVYKGNNFNVRLTYAIAGATDETTIPITWRSGWLDLGSPTYKKQLRKIIVDYDSASTGTLNIGFETYGDGNSDSFAIDLANYPSEYIEYFANGSLLGELFRITITESSLNPIKVKSIRVVYDIEPNV
jgi:hypothetical protein